MGTYLGQVQDLDWTSPSRIFTTTAELFNSQPNYEHEVAIALDTHVKYQGTAPVVGGWSYATGAPVLGQPPIATPPVNDAFTKLLLEFDGKEGSRTYPDTNAANWPRVWKTHGYAGFGRTTNVGELFPDGALLLDGRTVLTAPDDFRFDFRDYNFTVRGYFVCDFPLDDHRVLFGKTNQETGGAKRFMITGGRTSVGEFFILVDTRNIVDHFLLDRFGNQIVDRNSELIASRFELSGPDDGIHLLQSTTLYTDTVNVGWHKFLARRVGPTLELFMDDVLEDTNSIGVEVVNKVCGPITIASDGPPLGPDQVLISLPWRGKLDRFAWDIGIGR